jgi:hypothetical protein
MCVQCEDLVNNWTWGQETAERKENCQNLAKIHLVLVNLTEIFINST